MWTADSFAPVCLLCEIGSLLVLLSEEANLTFPKCHVRREVLNAWLRVPGTWNRPVASVLCACQWMCCYLMQSENGKKKKLFCICETLNKLVLKCCNIRFIFSVSAHSGTEPFLGTCEPYWKGVFPVTSVLLMWDCWLSTFLCISMCKALKALRWIVVNLSHIKWTGLSFLHRLPVKSRPVRSHLKDVGSTQQNSLLVSRLIWCQTKNWISEVLYFLRVH